MNTYKAYKDITGIKYHCLTAASFSHKDSHKKAKWLFKCDCGNEKTITRSSVVSGLTKSCGCHNKKIATKRFLDLNTKHRYRSAGKKDKTYLCWQNIKTRCLNKNNAHYHSYGGRGIGICDRWKESFENFLEDMGERPRYVFIDRIDNNKGYYKENCRWISTKRQTRNRRGNLVIEYKGEEKSLAEWCEIHNKDYARVWQRIKKLNWDFNRAISTSTKKEFNVKRK